ncbi:MAG: DUF4406 domain-containing protein [Clostridiales bacterium]|nr:DUF4406 domain-containing protein [Clostridiales bacterium]
MNVYIAGKMAGLPDKGRVAFDRAENQLVGLGHQVLNPARIGDGLPKAAYMPICLSMIQQAQALVLLEGWESSPGARLERAFAEYQEMPVYTLEEVVRKVQAKGVLWTGEQSAEVLSLKEELAEARQQLKRAIQSMRETAAADGTCVGCKHLPVAIEDSPACMEADCERQNCKDPCPCKGCEGASHWEWEGA